MLHVTNGSVAGDLIARSGLDGDVLAWDDVLHEGPVPAIADRRTLPFFRARFLASAGLARYREALERLRRRDARLEQAIGREPIVLWFEADLFDQLQLLQILDRLAGGKDVALICIDEHPAVERFHGLGQLEPEHFPPLFAERAPVTKAELDLAGRAWQAFIDPSPEAVHRLRAEDLSALPYLDDAFGRLLQELPSATDGLSRTERALLMPLYDDPCPFVEAFRIQARGEERQFLGDSVALWRLSLLARGESPLLTMNGELALTETGRRVLAGKVDAVEVHGIDRWIGGVSLSPDLDWRWDPIHRTPVLR
jgi:hypothetical protein